jgi:hypothetical protein
LRLAFVGPERQMLLVACRVDIVQLRPRELRRLAIAPDELALDRVRWIVGPGAGAGERQ